MHLGPNSEITVIGGEGIALRPAVLRFDSQGQLVWNVRLAGVGFAMDIARGPSGEILVASNVAIGNESRGVTVEITPNGEIAWEHERSGARGRSDAHVVQVHPHGGAVVGGVQRGGDYLDFLVYRLDSNGDLLWEYVYDRGGDDFLVDLIVAADGDVLLFGHSSAGAGYDWAVHRISPDGELRWSRFFDQAAGCARQMLARRILPDGDGGAYIAGSISNTPNPDHEELGIARLRADGSIAWALQIPTDGYRRGIRDMSMIRTDSGRLLVAYNETVGFGSTVGRLAVIDDEYLGTTVDEEKTVVMRASAYPNPTSTRLHVATEASDIERIHVVDVIGRQVAHVMSFIPGGRSIEFDVSMLTSGQYFIVVETAVGRRVVPFTVAR
jgi:outer membrane protein assembly factor BamB